MRLTLQLDDPAATAALAVQIARILRRRDVIALAGDLGCGKTAFARALIRARGRADEEVPSPTFTLVQTYDTSSGGSDAGRPLSIWHFDLYRLRTPEEAFELGIEDAFADGISLIEWPDRLGELLPSASLVVTLAAMPDAGETVRTVMIEGDDAWRRRLAEVGLV